MEHLDIPSPPPLISMMSKWHVFAPSRLHYCFGGGGGGWRIIVPFYSVHDCSQRVET